MLRTNQRDGPAKDEKERPAETDYAPRCLILYITVSNEAADAVDRQITQAEVFKFLAEKAQNEADQHWQFVTQEICAADFPGWTHCFQPVIPRLFMAMTGGAGLGPCFERQVQTFDTDPVKESS